MLYRKMAVSIIISISILISNINSFADTTAIKDINKASDFAKPAITSLSEKGIIEGDSKGNVNPKKLVTRAELITILARALELDTDAAPEEPTFSDVPKKHWANRYVEAAYKAGIVNGNGEGTFGPDLTCTREQMAAMLVRALKLGGNVNVDYRNISAFADRRAISAWARRDVEIALMAGIMNGTGSGSFSPRGLAAKEQAIVVTDRFLQKRENINDILSKQPASLREIILTYNGDEIPLPQTPVVENGQIMVPMDFLQKYFGSHLDKIEDPGQIYTKPDYAGDTQFIDFESHRVWFKVGAVSAYKVSPQDQDPFEDAASNGNNAIELSAAPLQKNGMMYIPLSDMCKLVGASYSFDEVDYLLKVSNKNAQKFPKLHYAMRKSNSNFFRGDVKVSAVFSETKTGDPTLNGTNKIEYELYKRVNHIGQHMKLKSVIQNKSGKPQSLELEEISVPSSEIEYIRDSNPGEWLPSNFDGLKFLSKFTELNPLENIKEPYRFFVGNDLMWNFEQLPLKKIGQVTLNGKKATMYTVSFDKSNIRNALISHYFMYDFNTEYYSKLGYTIDFYVVDEDIVKYTYKWDGEKYYSPQNLLTKEYMYLDMEFENYGKNLEIKKP